jgi:hypothetical protein
MGKSIQVSVLFENREIDNLIDFCEVYPDLALETARDTFNAQVKPALLSELQHYPGPVRYPFEFKSDRSRRYYFATHTPPYQRTGALAAGWKADVLMSDNAVALSVSNPIKYLPFVIGRFQQPGHARTGWPLFAPTVSFWKIAAVEVIMKALNRLVNQKW